MKISFCRAGYVYLAYKGMLEKVGHEIIVPPKPTKKTIAYGTKHAPEYACFPAKIILGTYKEALDLGADTIISTSGGNYYSCNSTEFNKNYERILKDQGYNFKLLNVNLKTIPEAAKILGISATMVPDILGVFLGKLRLIENAQDRYREILAYGRYLDAKKFLHKVMKKIDKTQNIHKMIKLNTKIKRYKYKKIRDKVIKIGLTGDLFTILEPAINNDLVEKLAKLGVHSFVEKKLSHSIQGNLMLGPLGRGSKNYSLKTSKPYLTRIPGFANDTIAHTIDYAKTCDGVIQLYPFTCMPEIVAKTILPKISKDFDIPILHLPVDEQTGEAGMQTRIEAFVDLLKIKVGQ